MKNLIKKHRKKKEYFKNNGKTIVEDKLKNKGLSEEDINEFFSSFNYDFSKLSSHEFYCKVFPDIIAFAKEDYDEYVESHIIGEYDLKEIVWSCLDKEKLGKLIFSQYINNHNKNKNNYLMLNSGKILWFTIEYVWPGVVF